MIIYKEINIKSNNLERHDVFDGEACAQLCLEMDYCVAFTMNPSGAYAGVGPQI